VGRGDVRRSMRFCWKTSGVRLQTLRAAVPNICFQMLLRRSKRGRLHGRIRIIVVRRFVEVSAKDGIDFFLI